MGVGGGEHERGEDSGTVVSRLVKSSAGMGTLQLITIPRFLQIRLGKESCDQISASPNRPKRAKSRDKTTGSLFTRAYTLVKSVKLKGVSSRFYNKTCKDK